MNALRPDKYGAVNIDMRKLASIKKIGRVNTIEAIRNTRSYIDFNGKVYVIGGEGIQRNSAGISNVKKFSSIYVSDDMLKWKKIKEKVPWPAKYNDEGNILTVFKRHIYFYNWNESRE